jgi:hypothetical protein
MKSRTHFAACGVAVAAFLPQWCRADIDGTRAAGISGQEICIVDNGYTGTDFRDAYDRQIRARGFATRIVHAKSECPITTTFVATYARGWGRYLRDSMLTVFRDGEEIGVVRYHGSRHKPFKGTVESVIGEMVAVLYPAGSGKS